MSGHSKWSTIKRKKEATDKAKGQVFSRMAKNIAIAIKTGGGPNPETNYKLRMAIDSARTENMPKANIERALKKAEAQGDLDEIVYEGFGPGGAGLLVVAATDNRNRTGQEIKGIIERGGGSLAGPGSVSHGFVNKSLLVFDNPKDDQLLNTLIDLGVEDVEESDGELEAYVDLENVGRIRDGAEEKGFVAKRIEMIKKPTSLITLDEKDTTRNISLVDRLESHDDVQGVFTNLDIADELFEKISSES